MRTSEVNEKVGLSGSLRAIKDLLPTASQEMTQSSLGVSAEQAAQFLSIKRRYLLALARKGIAGAYALGTGTVRKIWVFRLSELAAAVARNAAPQNAGSVRSSDSGSPR